MVYIINGEVNKFTNVRTNFDPYHKHWQLVLPLVILQCLGTNIWMSTRVRSILMPTGSSMLILMMQGE